jgi:ATP-dependent Zn protease
MSLLAELRRDGLDLGAQVTEVFVSLAQRKGLYQSVIAGVAELQALLRTQIFDQDQAVEAVCDAVMRMAWSEPENRPRAIFSFLGPPATGKTYMAQLLGQGLQGYAVRAFDMTQFPSDKEGFALVGLRKGFEGAGEGQLTRFVKRHPKSIIVFDEIEKSHTRVQASLLRMLSAGFLKDEYSDEDIDFRETIVVFTSNLGSSYYSNRRFLEQTRRNPHQARETLLQVIRQETKIESGHKVAAIPAEMMSRLAQGSVILFNRLSLDGLSRIAMQQVDKERKAFEHRLGLALEFDDLAALVRLLVLGFAPEFDARVLRSRLSDQVFDPVTDHLLAQPQLAVSRVRLGLDASAEHFLAGLDLAQLPTQLATRRQKIYFDRHIVVQGDTLQLTYTQPRIEKLAGQDDFSDASGIQVDLPEIAFDHIAGHTQIKRRLREVVNLVRNRAQLAGEGIRPPKGMLLHGVPGTGKTMLAKAFAHEAGLPFLACAGNDLLNEAFIQKLFARARMYAPAIIFIDEVDALPRRGTAGPGADALVNRLLVEIDGFNQDDGDIFIIAATNRKELIDPAILRSGRIDLHHEVPNLDKEARRWFVERMLHNPRFEADIDVDRIILLTAGFSGADLQKLTRESILLALREALPVITEAQLIEQINLQKYGEPLDLDFCHERLRETAYHEAAHAVVSRTLLPGRRIEQISVVARANALGMVSYDHEQEHDYTREFLFSLTCIALAGRAAQIRQHGPRGLDGGASGDLKQAMHYAWFAIAELGMDAALYNLSSATLQEKTGAAAFQQAVERSIAEWIRTATEQTERLVEQSWPKIVAVAERVLLDEIIDEPTLIHLMENH